MEISVPPDFYYADHVYIVAVHHPLDIRVYQKEFHEMDREEKQIEYTCAALGLGKKGIQPPTLDTKRVTDLRVLCSNDEELGYVQAILVPNRWTPATRERIIYQQRYTLNTAQVTHDQIQERLIQEYLGPLFS